MHLRKHEVEQCGNRRVPWRNQCLGCNVMVKLKERDLHEFVDGKRQMRNALYLASHGAHLAIKEDDIPCPWTAEYWIYRPPTTESAKSHIRNIILQIPNYNLAYVAECCIKNQVLSIVNILKSPPDDSYMSNPTLSRDEKTRLAKESVQNRLDMALSCCEEIIRTVAFKGSRIVTSLRPIYPGVAPPVKQKPVVPAAGVENEVNDEVQVEDGAEVLRIDTDDADFYFNDDEDARLLLLEEENEVQKQLEIAQQMNTEQAALKALEASMKARKRRELKKRKGDKSADDSATDEEAAEMTTKDTKNTKRSSKLEKRDSKLEKRDSKLEKRNTKVEKIKSEDKLQKRITELLRAGCGAETLAESSVCSTEQTFTRICLSLNSGVSFLEDNTGGDSDDENQSPVVKSMEVTAQSLGFEARKHYDLLIKASDQKALNKHMGKIDTSLSDVGLVAWWTFEDGLLGNKRVTDVTAHRNHATSATHASRANAELLARFSLVGRRADAARISTQISSNPSEK
eukprot:gene28906-35858_t